MGNFNLSRSECAERAELVGAESYEVYLDLSDPKAETFRSTTRATFTCAEPGASTWIDLQARAVESITLNGTSLDPAEVVDEDRIRLDGLAASNVVEIVAQCVFMNSGEGLHKFIDPVDGEVYLYTQFETADSRRMYANFEQPALKATFQLSLIGPSHWTVLSNSPTPQAVAVDEGLSRWDFEPTPRMSTYITALVAGPYKGTFDTYTGPHGTYRLGAFARASMFEFLDAETVFLETKQGFAFFEETFGLGYPFAKYDQIFVPEFNAGAMENAGCVTLREDYVFRSRVTDSAYETRSNTILHELAHMWFGDLVTMTWWDDLWLNESFAEWASHFANARVTRHKEAWTTFLNQRKAWAYRQDQLPSTHPIATDMVDLETVRLNFDGITYAKGASALRQLVAYVGEDEFIAGLKTYFAKHAWGNTTLEDLLVELEASSGRDLHSWAHEWLKTAGVNLLRPIVEVAEDGTYSRVAISQEPPACPEGLEPVLRSHRIAVGLYDMTEAGLVRRQRLELDVTGSLTEVPELGGVAQPDLLLLNDDDLTYAKIRLDDRSRTTAIASIGELDSSLARALIWGAAWDMLRDAEMSAGDYVRLVLSGIPGEGDVGVVQVIMRQAKAAIDQFAAPAKREALLGEFSAGIQNLLEQAEPGSDHQLALFRMYVATARSEDQLDHLGALLAGDTEVKGLSIDTDLRWGLVQRLCSKGRFGDAQIDAELGRDDTASGRVQAAVARAGIPTAEAKDRAWHAVLDNNEMPNALLVATFAGFNQADHRELLKPYRDRYFDSMVAMWESRTPEMAKDIAVGLFPFLMIEQDTLDAADGFLARTDLPDGLRRCVAEGRDGMARALRCQTFDASA